MKVSKDLIVINCMIFLITGITAIYGFFNIIKLQSLGNLGLLFRFSDYEGIYNLLNYSFIVMVFIMSMGIFSFKDLFRKLMRVTLFCIMVFNSSDFILKKFYMNEAESYLFYLVDFLFLVLLIFYFGSKRIKKQFNRVV